MIKIIEGDFYNKGAVILDKRKKIILVNNGFLSNAKYRFDQVEKFQELSQDNAKSALGTIGWGAAGAVALGGLGLLAGVLCGGNKKKVGFVLKFTDGKVVICQGSRKEVTEISFALGAF